MPSNHTRNMKLALEEAAKGLQAGTLPVGCVLVAKHSIIAKNRKSESDKYLGHAEIRTLTTALAERHFERSDDLTLYTTLEPCAMCFGTIMHCPIARVVIAMEDAYGGAVSAFTSNAPKRHEGKTPEIIWGICREESLDLLRSYLNTGDTPAWMTDRTNPFIRRIRGLGDADMDAS